MSIYQEGAGQIDDNFLRKDMGIAQLGNPDPFIRATAMGEFGFAMSRDDRLTHQMQMLLIAKLNASGLLTYERDIYKESMAAEKSEDELLKTFDLVRWEVERNGTVQAHVIKAAALLSQDDITDSHKVLRVADLLGKMRYIPKSFKIPFTVEPYAASLTRLADTEEAIYLERPFLIRELINIHLEDRDKWAHVTARDREGFKALSRESQLYNRIVAIDFLRKSTAQDIEGRFRELQAVAHYGYTKDIRDAGDFYTMYGGK